MNLKKTKQKQTKQITRTGTESQKWRSYGGLSAGKGKGEQGEKGTWNKKHNWLVQHRQGAFQNGIGNGEAKELICMTHEHELRRENTCGRGVQGGGSQRGEKNETTVIT